MVASGGELFGGDVSGMVGVGYVEMYGSDAGGIRGIYLSVKKGK